MVRALRGRDRGEGRGRGKGTGVEGSIGGRRSRNRVPDDTLEFGIVPHFVFRSTYSNDDFVVRRDLG